MTTLTILQTFKLLEEVQLPATFDKIVEVSGQDATDVALNLKLNMEHLDVDDRTSGSGTIYSLKYPVEYENELRKQGRLLEYYVKDNGSTTTPEYTRYEHFLVVTNSDLWEDFTYSDVTTYIGTYISALPEGFQSFAISGDDINGTDFGFYVGYSGQAATDIQFVTDDMKGWEVTSLPKVVEVMAHFGIIYKPNVKMPEEWWTDLPGSLF